MNFLVVYAPRMGATVSSVSLAAEPIRGAAVAVTGVVSGF
jgi:hypothetical protein